MKRQRKTWKEKLGTPCLSYLEAHKRLRGTLLEDDNLINSLFDALFRGDLQAFSEHLARAKPSPFPKIPGLEETKTVGIESNFAQLTKGTPLGEALTPGPLACGPRLADVLALVQRFTVTFEPNKEARIAIYFFLSIMIVNLRELLADLYKQQFGNEPIEIRKACAVTAMALESFASAFRGRFATPKGKINIELVELVKFIRKHEKESLSPAEMREALLSAGVSVPAGDTFRLWLWRTKKKNLIPRKTS